MSVGPDDLTDSRFAELGEAGIVELCGSLADYGEAGGLSRDLMLQVGRFSEARYGRNLEVLLAVSRMYLLGGETTRAKAALLRAGKLWPDEARVQPLLEHALRLLDDPRPVEQVIREAPALPPLHATPPPMPAVRSLQVPPTSLATPRVMPRRIAPRTPPGLPILKLPPEARKTTPRFRSPAAATPSTRGTSTRPPAADSTATPVSGIPIVPRAPGLPRGVEGAVSSPRASVSRATRPAETRGLGGAVAARAPEEAGDPARVRTEVSRRLAREAAQAAPVPAPDSSPRALAGGGVARSTRIRLLDPEDERRHLDPYELIGEIASGGMATVFLGRLAGAGGFQRFVAIKRLHPHLAREEEFVEMFLDEARIAAGIHNPHVVPILEVGTSDQGFFLVMEFVEGDTLSGLTVRALQRGAALPPAVALRIVVDALTGLHAAHQLHDADGRPLGLVHRDCTPQNILVGVDGSARITDFGVARAAARITMTRPQQVKGKVGYLSPEQAHAQDLDRRCDLFTMGIVLWEALAGRPLFQAETEAVTLGRLLTGPIPSLRSFAPDLPASLDDVCRGALQRDPARRYRTAAEMVEAIERAANAEGSVGIASPRELGRFVESIMGAEIAAQREAVRAWLAQQSDAAPMSRGPRSLGGSYITRPPASPRTAGPATPRSGVHTAAPSERPPETPPAAKASPAAPIAEKPAAPPAKPVEAPRAAPAAEKPAPVAEKAPAAKPAAAPAEIEATLPAGPAVIERPAPAAAPPAEPPVVKAPARAPLRMPAFLSRLLSVKLKTRTGLALIAVLVLLATAPLALRAVRARRSARNASRTTTTTGARGPRQSNAKTPIAKPRATGWDEGEWLIPDGGLPAPDEAPAEP